jgi:hypothetical protein
MSGALDPFALGGYQQPTGRRPPVGVAPNGEPGIGADTRSCPLLALWREYKAIDALLSEVEVPGDEEDRLVDRLRAVEDEIAGSIATNASDIMAQLSLLVSYWRDCEMEWGDFIGGLVGKMYLGLYAIEGAAI